MIPTRQAGGPALPATGCRAALPAVRPAGKASGVRLVAAQHRDVWRLTRTRPALPRPTRRSHPPM